MKVSEVGNTVTMEKSYLTQFVEEITRIASKEGVESYKIEKMKNEDLSTNEVAEELGVTRATVIRYTKKDGHKVAGILPSSTKGRNLIFNKYEVIQFKERMKN